MSQPLSPDMEMRLDQYLSNRLNAADREVFEHELSTNTVLRQAIDQQRQVDASLKRLFSAPAAGLERVRAAVLNANNAGPGAAPQIIKLPSRKPWMPMAIAAAFMLMMFGGWWYWNPFRKGPDDPIAQSRPLAAAYRDELARGFVPEWECREEKRFRETFERRFGQSMLATIPSGATVWGLSYRTAITRQTVLLLAKVNDVPIVVFVDRARDEKGLTISPGDRLQLFKRTIGKLVLCEVTPLDEPTILELFQDTTKP